MKGLEQINLNKNLVAIIIRSNVNLKNNIHFFTDPSDSLQIGFHRYNATKHTNIHNNKIEKPLIITKKNKYLYMIKGSATLELINNQNKVLRSIKLKTGDSVVINDIAHKIIFNKNSNAVEIKQGPYEENK